MSTTNAPALLDEKWVYPDGWSDEQKRTWEGIQGRKIAESRALTEIQERAAAAAAAPEALLAAARAEADEAQREREREQRRAEGEAAWRKAREERAGRIERIDTAEGDVIILRPMTRPECEAVTIRAMNLSSKAATPALGHSDFMGAHRDAMLASVLYPPRERVKALTEMYPALWAHIERGRDKLIDGRRLDEGKGSAL